MNEDAKLALEELGPLVAVDSQNPPRRQERIVATLKERLASSFDVRVHDLGDGCVAIFATRGASDLLFNVHVDTVPVVPGWTRDPFALTVDDEHAYGLGACDTKGAAAALLAAARTCDAPVALLFTTDEEAGQARCATWFAEEPRGYRAVVASEPTENHAVLAHRGVGSARVVFRGDAGHASSGARRSANHELVAWASRALAHAEKERSEGRDVRLNLGRLDGGEKPNVVAARAEARFGVRPPPGTSPDDVLRALLALAPSDPESGVTFVGDSLPSRGKDNEAARRVAEAWGVTIGDPVDFWTEAAIFATRAPSLVYGPGSIREAHSKDEFVSLESLGRAVADYRRAFAVFAGRDERSSA